VGPLELVVVAPTRQARGRPPGEASLRPFPRVLGRLR
jgi:hypothetical protein